MTNRLFIAAMFFLAACHQKPQTIVQASEAIQVDTLPGECPYLTKDTKGNTVLSWVRTAGDTTAFCYAVSSDGKTFAPTVVIPNTGNIQPHGENMPKIVFKPSGEIIALWGAANPSPKNKYSGLVFYTSSVDGGKNWSGVKPLVQDTASYDQRYYDVAILPNGEAAAIWLDNRKTLQQEGSALYYTATNGSHGFENAHLVSQPCCQCCRTKLFVDTKGAIHALYRAIIQDSIRDMVHVVSADGGKTFSAPERISQDNWVLHACPHTGPAMTENKNGLHFTWYTGSGNAGSYYTQSTRHGKPYNMRDSVSEKGTHPQITAVGNSDLLIVWDENEVAGDHVYKKIGVERRTTEGRALGKLYLTDKSNTNFPVVAPIQNKGALVAYTKQVNNMPFVTCQFLVLN